MPDHDVSTSALNVSGRLTAHEVRTDNELLVAFEHGDPVAREQLPERLSAILLKCVRKIRPHYPPGRLEEVIQQMWLTLLEREPRFDPGRSQATTYLFFQLRNAARKIDAQYRPAGQRARLAEREKGGRPSLEALESTDALADAESSVQLERRTEVRRILALARHPSAPAGLFAVLQAIYGGGSMTEAARAASLSRRSLYRRLTRMRERLSD